MKSNVEYLKESLSAKNEWLYAIEAEMKSKDETIARLTKSVENLKIEFIDLEAKTSELEMELEGKPSLKKIDCGIGTIEYIEPDNLKLQMIMEDFKEKHSVHAC